MFVYILLISLFSYFRSQDCFTQNKDSLWKVYNDKAQVDTNRLKAIQTIAINYFNIKPDSTIIMAEQELELAKQKAQKKFEGKALYIIGHVYLSKDNFSKALGY